MVRLKVLTSILILLATSTLCFAEPFDGRNQVRNSPYKPAHPENIPIVAGSANGYTKQQYIDVWCEGTQNVYGVDCLTDYYAVSFYPVSDWFLGITKATIRAKKLNQTPVAFLYVTDVGADTKYMREARAWAKQQKKIIVFATIDAGIPGAWIP